MAPIDKDGYLEVMKTNNEVLGGMNMFFMDLVKPATPGIPINKSSVMSLSNQKFMKPIKFPQIIVIGVDHVGENIFESLGALHVVTPLELLHAMIFAVVRDIQAVNPKVPPEILEAIS